MLVYITIGGLSGAIYNEVLQFFVILAGLIPVTVVGLVKVGGWHGLHHQGQGVGARLAPGCTPGSARASAATTRSAPTSSASCWGSGSSSSFGYWTTNFAEVQRALSAKSLSAAQRTPLIGAYPKLFIPALTVIPGLVALVVDPAPGGQVR